MRKNDHPNIAKLDRTFEDRRNIYLVIESSSLKLVDFGFACEFSAGQVLKERVGSTGYVAPQVLDGEYDHMCDLWSCGVVMYLLLCGCLPFTAKTDSGVCRAV